MDLPDATVPVGKLWTRSRGARETASFEYDPSWLSHRHAFGLAPGLPLARGPFHTDRPLFNAFTDSAPDRWGQTLLRRNERRRARAEGRQPRTLRAVDFVVLVGDEARLGALRFQDHRTGRFLTSMGRSVPPLVDLPRPVRRRKPDHGRRGDGRGPAVAPRTGDFARRSAAQGVGAGRGGSLADRQVSAP